MALSDSGVSEDAALPRSKLPFQDRKKHELAGKSVPDGEESRFNFVTTCRNVKKPAATAGRKARPGVRAGAQQPSTYKCRLKDFSKPGAGTLTIVIQSPCARSLGCSQHAWTRLGPGAPRSLQRGRGPSAQQQLQPGTASRV